MNNNTKNSNNLQKNKNDRPSVSSLLESGTQNFNTGQNKNHVSSPALIAIILVITIIGLAIMMVFERYLAPELANKVLLRIILLGVIINLAITVFLVYSFSRVTFARGPRGPAGIRGSMGPSGNNSEIDKCSKQIKTITKERNDRRRASTIVIQKPAI